MANNQKELLKKALDFYGSFAVNQDEDGYFQDQNYLSQKLSFFKEAAKAEGVSKSEYGLAPVAIVLSEMKMANHNGMDFAGDFMAKHELLPEEEAEISAYLDFLDSERDEGNEVEELLRDTQYLHLGMPDALEKLERRRSTEEQKNNVRYTEPEWLNNCKDHFIKHSFNSNYTIKNFGVARSKNFIELEKRIDKVKSISKEKNGNAKNGQSEVLSDKEGEEMFKLAFRNSVNLISVADSKAGMLIQINTLLAGFVFTLGVAKFEDNAYYVIPTAAILIGSALTVFFGILASRPVKRDMADDLAYDKIGFFFGSYDRLDIEARKVSWEKYSTDMSDLLEGNKKFVFKGLIRESYEVSKVLSMKFGYLSLAYKIFFAGLLIGILGFLTLIIYEYNTVVEHTPSVTSTPF